VLIVVRHGRTAANASGLLLGRRLDPGLDELGRRQAAALGAALAGASRVVSSPLRRARETAEALGGAVSVDERWAEVDYGELDGMPLADVPAETWARWRADPDHTPPGGESLRQLAARVRPACDELLAEAAEADIVVVTHVSPVKAAVAWALGVGDDVAWRMWCAPASITRIGTSRGEPSLHGYNDVSHLAGLEGGHAAGRS
jgi:broad specificity phosphatase PhoE